MPRANATATTKLQLTVDVNTGRVMGEIAKLGIHGVNKADVASTLLRMWIWDNQTKLRDNGIDIRPPSNLLEA